MFSLLGAGLAPFALADHPVACDLGGARCYQEPDLDAGGTKVVAIEIKATTADVTVFPCYGEFTW